MEKTIPRCRKYFRCVCGGKHAHHCDVVRYSPPLYLYYWECCSWRLSNKMKHLRCRNNSKIQSNFHIFSITDIVYGWNMYKLSENYTQIICPFHFSYMEGLLVPSYQIPETLPDTNYSELRIHQIPRQNSMARFLIVFIVLMVSLHTTDCWYLHTRGCVYNSSEMRKKHIILELNREILITTATFCKIAEK
jgi:hypothetical protein